MDHGYRGSALTHAQRATALKSVKKVCEDVWVDVASLDEVLTFAQTGLFVDIEQHVCKPYHFWNALHPSASAAPLGKVLASLGASQAPTERVFSSADSDWQSDYRERLSFEMLSREIYINQKAQNYASHCLWTSPLQLGCTHYVVLETSWTLGIVKAFCGSPMGPHIGQGQAPSPQNENFHIFHKFHKFRKFHESFTFVLSGLCLCSSSACALLCM